jgi:hypothetical protein
MLGNQRASVRRTRPAWQVDVLGKARVLLQGMSIRTEMGTLPRFVVLVITITNTTLY